MVAEQFPKGKSQKNGERLLGIKAADDHMLRQPRQTLHECGQRIPAVDKMPQVIQMPSQVSESLSRGRGGEQTQIQCVLRSCLPDLPFTREET